MLLLLLSSPNLSGLNQLSANEGSTVSTILGSLTLNHNGVGKSTGLRMVTRLRNERNERHVIVIM